MKALLLLLLTAALLPPARASSNLLTNGSFDDPDYPLKGWKYKYDKEGESFYFKNHEFVKVEPRLEGRTGVLALFGTQDMVAGTGQGTKVDSFPVEVKPGGRYRLTLTARSVGPGTRTLVEGYQWRPGVKPHRHPDLSEIRKCFKSELVYFGSQQGGTFASVTKNWQTASVTVPDEKLSPLAAEKLSKMEFLVVHIVAIQGSEGTLYIDDVKLEQVSEPRKK
jgi:hypothetical protein